jgi:peptidoglycan hydrolase-like protein with peptidoglycan-binding domain
MYGWVGHQHVPENDHGDPGALAIDRVLAHAAEALAPPKPTKVLPVYFRGLPGARTIRPGMRGDDVKALKVKAGIRPTNGIYGPVLAARVIARKRKAGLPGGAIVGARTWQLFGFGGK